MNIAAKNKQFSNCYLAVREKESRLLSDSEVFQLPEMATERPLAGEWKKRAWSSRQLKNYLGKKNKPLTILEVGCGNGWLCHQLSQINETHLTGIDINGKELRQAKRVFGKNKNIMFLHGTLEDLLPSFRFDVILFAASIQYFPDLHRTILNAIKLLNNGGEIHILDSHFYDEDELGGAQQRSRDHFNALNEPGMTAFYFHHAISSLALFRYKWMYKPGSWINKLKRSPSPFPWIRIEK